VCLTRAQLGGTFQAHDSLVELAQFAVRDARPSIIRQLAKSVRPKPTSIKALRIKTATSSANGGGS